MAAAFDLKFEPTNLPHLTELNERVEVQEEKFKDIQDRRHVPSARWEACGDFFAKESGNGTNTGWIAK